MDVDVDVEEDVVLDNRLMLMLPCRCRMQVLLDLLCNRSREQPQCPHSNRETEWALSWLAQAAGGAVGTSSASRPKGDQGGCREGKTDKDAKIQI